jgi:hypothetical protein
MNPKRTRQAASLLAAALFVTAPGFSFDLPLSSESVREAYFLGQRHDGSSGRLLENYTKHLPPPDSGPYISSIAFFTPFAQLVQFCDRYVGNYTAQQALLDHRGQEELVKITVEIYLTASYGALIPNPAGSQSGSSPALIPRPYDFWRDFRVQVHNGNQIVSPSISGGHLLYRCGRFGHCRPMGAALELEFPANDFTSDSVTVQVIPPEGDSVSVDFDLIRLR